MNMESLTKLLRSVAAGKTSVEDAAARRLLLSALDDPAPAVRVEAAHALGEGAFREALRPLLELKSSDPAPEVRQAAAGALRKLQPR